ncbi:MAG: RDD family protein [Pseudomonadota bacterium]|nr:RDD family protein [Pseudomonadota bacterium]
MTEAYGGFWRRALAFLIDQAILNVIYLIFLLAGGLFNLLGQAAGGGPSWPAAAADAGVSQATAGFALLYSLAVVLVTVLYYIWFVAAAGRTPGKMILDLHIRPVKGGEIAFGVAFLRFVAYLVSGAPLYLGFLWIAIDPRKQGWHDKIAGTVVVRERRPPLDSAASPCL